MLTRYTPDTDTKLSIVIRPTEILGPRLMKDRLLQCLSGMALAVFLEINNVDAAAQAYLGANLSVSCTARSTSRHL